MIKGLERDSIKERLPLWIIAGREIYEVVDVSKKCLYTHDERFNAFPNMKFYVTHKDAEYALITLEAERIKNEYANIKAEYEYMEKFMEDHAEHFI